MQYDPIKRSLGKVFNKSTSLRKLFYRLLDLLLLRAWHVNKVLRNTKLGEQSAILDAGSGFGQYTYRMSKLFPLSKIKAIDVKSEQVSDCNEFMTKIGQNNRVVFEVGDLTKYVEKEQFDFILSVDVMEHIEDDVRVFKNFHASLKENGTLLVSTPSDQGGSDSHDHDHDDINGFIDEHVRDGYNINEIKEKLESAGFKNIETRYTYGKPGSLAWKLSMKYPIQLLGVSKIFFIILPIYYIVAYPVSAVLNWFDVNLKHKTGTGLIVTANK